MFPEMKTMKTDPSLARLAAPLVAILAVSAMLVVAAGCGGDAGSTALEDTRASIPVETRGAQLVTESVGTSATGSVEPITRAMPGTKIMGRIARVPAREGNSVRKGQLLAELESADLQAALEQAKAGVAMAEAQLENARATHERMKDLHARGSVTDKNLEDAIAGFRMAEAGLKQAEANVSAAQVMLSYARIVSPISGQVVERRVEAGDMAAPGMPMFVIEDVSRVKLIVQVPESEIATISEGDVVRVGFDAIEGSFESQVHRVLPAADRMSRTFDVELRLDNPDGVLKSGMFARARFAQGEREVLALEKSALVRRGQLEGVFVVEGEHARLRWLRLGPPLADGRVEVLSGLEGGEVYVPNPPPALVDGSPVSAR